MPENIAEKQLSDHRAAVAATMAELVRVPAAGYGSAAILARVTNALRGASARDPRRLTERERADMVAALGAAHAAVMKITADPSQASNTTVGFNTMGTLVLAWAGDARWTPGSGPFETVQNLALAWQLECMSTAVLDHVAAEQQQFEASRRGVIERLMSAGNLEN